MSELSDLTGSLKNAVAVPGEFGDLFPETTDTDLVAVLLDALAEAQLDGFLHSHDAQPDGLVEPDLTRAQGALLVIYASARMLANEIRNRKSLRRFASGTSQFEEAHVGVQVLVELLRQMQARKDRLLDEARLGDTARAFVMADQYMARAGGGTASANERAYDYQRNATLLG